VDESVLMIKGLVLVLAHIRTNPDLAILLVGGGGGN
jgi:hypothetical protein